MNHFYCPFETPFKAGNDYLKPSCSLLYKAFPLEQIQFLSAFSNTLKCVKHCGRSPSSKPKGHCVAFSQVSGTIVEIISLSLQIFPQLVNEVLYLLSLSIGCKTYCMSPVYIQSQLGKSGEVDDGLVTIYNIMNFYSILKKESPYMLQVQSNIYVNPKDLQANHWKTSNFSQVI